METIRKISVGLAGLCLLLLLFGIITGQAIFWQPAAVGLAVFTAIGLAAFPALKGYQYTAWIVTAVVAGMIYPSAFLRWGEFDLRNKWLIMIVVQLVMFGMGIQMSLRDFSGLASTWRGVLVGLLSQFSIMPIMGFILIKIFQFEPEIAAGVILIGSCSSGLASNVMVYIARANLVLSVTLTAIATLVAPFMTPLLMKLLAGTLIEIRFVDMMMEIIKIVLVPIGAALLHDYLKKASAQGWRNVLFIASISMLWLVALALGSWQVLQQLVPSALLPSVEMLGFFAGAVLAGIAYHGITRWFPRLDSYMPYFSMFGIIYFTTVTTAAGRDNLLQVGFLLFVAAVIHNAAGYFFGYWLSRAFGMDRNSARTVALEVGLQNGGMASGLAGTMGKLGTVGLASAVFSPWMNISGSILANYWRRKQLQLDEKKQEPVQEKAAA
ncbi:bile acid:sodium symporter family protein [Botryobacter ruber]|uniref:bile acid:sodium symporter family protein n=1 Tax=Botryobacter ruber TaxID=2171629 RepID=UPI000E0A7F0E|nr:bile acid:sodium symporter family protein [Botryobacter ruber]